jgi:hypothetical protein
MLTRSEAEQVARLYSSAQRAHNHAVIVEANALLNEYLNSIPLPYRHEERDRLISGLLHNNTHLDEDNETLV